MVMKNKLLTILDIVVVGLIIAAFISMFFGCKSTQKTASKTEITEASKSDSLVKSTFIDTSSKSQNITVKENNVVLEISKPVLIGIAKDSLSEEISNTPIGNSLSSFFNRLVSADAIKLTYNNKDSAVVKNSTAVKKESYDGNVSKQENKKQQDNVVSYKKIDGTKNWLWLWVIVALIALIWWKRNWIISKIL